MSDLVDSPLLQKASLALNKKYGILICTNPNCGFSLTENWEGHLARQHSSLKNLSQEERKKIQELSEEHPRQNLEIGQEMIEGLLVREGFQCAECGSISENESGVQIHLRKKNHGSKYERVNYQNFSPKIRFAV